MKKSHLYITKNTEVAEQWYVMSFKLHTTTQKYFSSPAPGQFISLAFNDIFFRRPFAVSDYIPHKEFSILYQVCPIRPHSLNSPNRIPKDNATSKMSKLSKGDYIDTIGFLGNSFSIPPTNSKPILVGGGIGLGPLLFFADILINTHAISPILIVGARTKSLLPLSLLEHCHADIHLCTDDGSMGHKATSIQLLNTILPQYITRSTLYFCGPLAMMYAGTKLADTYNITAYASLDVVMACSMGTCVGCVVPIFTHEKQLKWVKSCTDGPIFNTKDIIWNQLIR